MACGKRSILFLWRERNGVWKTLYIIPVQEMKWNVFSTLYSTAKESPSRNPTIYCLHIDYMGNRCNLYVVGVAALTTHCLYSPAGLPIHCLYIDYMKLT